MNATIASSFRTHRFGAWFALLVLAVWMIKRPYFGIWHDESLYALIALHSIHPLLYQNDLFFLYGSQASYTLFTPYLVAWIRHFGLDSGLMYATLTGQILWLAALLFLVTTLLPRRLWAWTLLAVALFRSQYTQTFGYAEPFVTPRLYAEAFSLLGLGLLLRRKHVLAWSSLLLGTLIHPLMGLPVMAVATLHHIRTWRMRVLLIAAGCVLAGGLVVSGIGPFAHVTQPLPGMLRPYEELRSPWLFIHLWPWDNISLILYSLIVLAFAIRNLDEPRTDLASPALLVALAGLALEALADLTHNSFLLSLQTVRFVWIAQLFAVLLWFPATDRLWNSGDNGRRSVLLLACGALGNPVGAAPYAMLGLGWWYAAARMPALAHPGRLLRLVFWLFPLQTLLWAILDGRLSYLKYTLFDQMPAGWSLITLLLPWCAIAVALCWRFCPTRRHALSSGLWLAAPAMLLFAATHWDMRTAERLPNTPQRERIVAVLQQRIPPGAVVYWEHSFRAPWFWLHRADYVSFQQLAGTIFTPDTAFEGMRRMRRLKAAGFPDSNWSYALSNSTSSDIKPHPLADAAYVCADPVLHTLILRYPIPGLASEYPFSDPNTGYHYYAYACRAVLNAEHAQPSITTPQGEPHA